MTFILKRQLHSTTMHSKIRQKSSASAGQHTGAETSSRSPGHNSNTNTNTNSKHNHHHQKQLDSCHLKKRRLDNNKSHEAKRTTFFTPKLPSETHEQCPQPNTKLFLLVVLTVLLVAAGLLFDSASAQTISIIPSDFERLIMPCYLGGGSYGNSAGSGGGGGYNPASSGGHYGSMSGAGASSAAYGSGSSQYQSGGRLSPSGPTSSGGTNGFQAPSHYGGETSGLGRSPAASSSFLGSSSQSGAASASVGLSSSLSGAGPLNGQPRDSLTNNLGQSVPRANTIENFIAIVNKIEVANPRLANNPDQLIRSLLTRFRLDNYYYDVRSRTPISEPDRRVTDILPALMSPLAGLAGGSGGPISSGQYGSMTDIFPDHLLEHDERCSMYFMLSHFVDKTSPSSPALGQMPVNQLAGPLNGQRPPSLQAAGTGYPGVSANLAYSGQGVGGAGQRYSGPSPSYGSPLTSQMNAFGTGISNKNPELAGQRNMHGVNSPQQTGQYNSALANANLRNANAAFPGTPARSPYIDGSGGSSRGQYNFRSNQQVDDRLAVEYGVVTTANQENSAIVLNRVLLGLLAATTPPQSIRQLASLIYPMQSLTNTPKLDEEIDPLFAVTLADLWAVSSIPKAGKPLDVHLLGASGHWNDLTCPTSFTLERASSIKFTTAELLGGLDGLNLGLFRRRLMSMRRHLRLSEILRIYYSKTGFKPQYPDVGVCARAAALNSHQDELHRNAENYLRLYKLSVPDSDAQISSQISRLDAFREIARQAANEQPEICLDSGSGSGGSLDLYPMNQADTCEISRADVVAVLDASPQANQPFMQLVAVKLAQRMGLSRDSNSLSIMTNQQDTSGHAGAYSFNTIVRNSTNLGEIGCALVHDTSSTYQGGQITEPTRLMEMFERALVNLDSEYLSRQVAVSASSSGNYNSDRQSSYVSSWFGTASAAGVGDAYGQSSAPGSGYHRPSGGPRNTGGAKIIIWFNYGSQTRLTSPGAGPTNWQPNYQQSQSYGSEGQEYRFYEAKKFLRENFRGASLLALSQSRDEVKPFVYDQEHDIITDIAPAQSGTNSIAGANGADAFGSAGSAFSSGQQKQLDAATYSMLSGQADQLVSKLIQRMCTVPALFQYPMCFRHPSDNTISVGYISPGRKQYWMMSPKTFFSSRSVRMVFKVDGGRLRVCFGRKPSPDETALKSNQQNGYSIQSQQISFNLQQQSGGSNNQQATTPPPQPSSSDYYTGMEYGVCKDVQQNQEIDFLVSDPCYKKSIAECEPFYFVIRELSQPGEGDPNYMCRDDGCRRIDQAKFIMSHTGVMCSSALKGIQANWFLIMISTLAASLISLNSSTKSSHGPHRAYRLGSLFKSVYSYVALASLVAYLALMQQVVQAQQQAGVYDFGEGRSGEKRGNLTPPEVVAIILVFMLILGGLALTIGLCYYVTKRSNRGMQPVEQDGY